MAGHGMMGVAEEGFPIFGRYAGRTQTTAKGVPHVVDTDAWQADLSARKLPCGVIHGPNPSAAIRDTQIGSIPRCACTIDHAASFRITTWARLALNATGGV